MIYGTWLAAAALRPGHSSADMTKARRDFYTRGADQTDQVLPCTFRQHQVTVAITRDDGVTHDLAPLLGTRGNFRDQHGHPVYRQSGQGNAA